MQITAATRVDEVLASPTPKPFMVRLAQVVFECDTMDYYRAFGQFRNVSDLAKLIELKRANAFDFSKAILHTDTGLRYPKDTSAIMAAASLAEAGEGDKIDLATLGLLDTDGTPLVKLSELCPGIPAATKPRTRKVATPPAVVETPPPQPPVEPVAPTQEEPAEVAAPPARRPRARAVAPTEPAVAPVELISEAMILARLDKLSADLADAFGTLVSEHGKVIDSRVAQLTSTVERREQNVLQAIDTIKEDIDALRGGVQLIGSALITINQNLQTLFAYIDPVETLKDIDLDEPTFNRGEPLGGEGVDAGSPEPTHESTPRVAPEPEEPESEGEGEPEDGGETRFYSESELSAMSLEELRTLADEVGVANASSIGFKTALIGRILKIAT